jgi:Tfp pilus assembly protein PilE
LVERLLWEHEVQGSNPCIPTNFPLNIPTIGIILSVSINKLETEMKHTKAFTLLELVILLVVIAILGVIIAGAFSKDAGAAELTAKEQMVSTATVIPTIPTYLNKGSAQYFYTDGGTLHLFKTGTYSWRSATDVCSELKRLDSGLKHVTLKITLADSIKIPKTKLPPISRLSEAVCN